MTYVRRGLLTATLLVLLITALPATGLAHKRPYHPKPPRVVVPRYPVRHYTLPPRPRYRTRTPVSATNGFALYVVRRGDTLTRIATRFGTSVQAILVANPRIRNPHLIYVGQRLSIPGAPAPASVGGAVYAAKPPPPASPPTMSPDERPGQVQVEMRNSSFHPVQIRVRPGTTLTWINRDAFAHTVTAGTRSNPTGLFDSGNLGAGGSFSFTFQAPGTYSYFCRIHPGMDGVVIVAP